MCICREKNHNPASYRVTGRTQETYWGSFVVQQIA